MLIIGYVFAIRSDLRVRPTVRVAGRLASPRKPRPWGQRPVHWGENRARGPLSTVFRFTSHVASLCVPETQISNILVM